MDNTPGDTLGVTMHINLMSGSISGPVIGATAPFSMANGFSGAATFYFPSTVSLTPGTMYFFTPIIDSGGPWNIDAESYYYAGGSEYNNGVIHAGNLWFREGLVVPEPSSSAMLLIVSGGFLFAKRTHHS